MKIYRQLLFTRSFWGIVKMYKGWRMGIGCGFIEVGTGMSGLHWPRKDATKGKPRPIEL